MKRTGFVTRQREPLKRRARLRSKRAKPGVTGRPSLDRQAWDLLKQQLWLRAKGRCEHCRGEGAEAHHVRKRSAGGSDVLENLTWLCPGCHRRTDAAYQDGRLVVEMFGGRPFFRTVYAKDKFTARTVSASSTGRNGGALSAAARSRRRPDQDPVVVPRSEQVYPTVPQRRGR